MSHDKFKAYWVLIGQPKLECKNPGDTQFSIVLQQPSFSTELDYRIKNDTNWELRRKWVESDFTLPIEYYSPMLKKWVLSKNPGWYFTDSYRESVQNTEYKEEHEVQEAQKVVSSKSTVTTENNGGKTGYYDVPPDSKTLNDLIEYKNMPFWRGEILKAAYGLEGRTEKNGGSETRELNKIIYYANRRLQLITKENIQ